MWSDNESSLDLLGFQHLTDAILAIVRNEALLPATIGVYGDWGSGKSSLLQMASAQLKKDEDVLVLPFNGWLFEGYEDAKTALMGTILEEIARHRKLSARALTLVKSLLKRVKVMRVLGSVAKVGLAYALGGPAGVGLAAGAGLLSAGRAGLEKAKDADLDKVGEYFEDEEDEVRRSIREFRKDFGDLLDETKLRTLVITIDDLDRCMPDTIIETLEAIKLFLFVPRTAFVLGADERLVKYAVRRRFPELPGERVEVGRDYLEKLVQFPIRVPPLGRTEIETYINLLFAKRAGLSDADFERVRTAVVDCDPTTLLEVRFNRAIAEKALIGGVPAALADHLALAQRIAPVLAAGLNGNPRQCKRFLNMLVMRLNMATSRRVTLQQRVLAKLMLLEYLRPESFKQLATAQAEQGGRPAELVAAERQRTAPRPVKPVPSPRGASPEPPDESGPAAEVPSWLTDSWTQEWVRSEPQLAGEDLRPYFFFSRDILGTLGGAVQRMSPAAQDILAEVFHDSLAVRGQAFKRARNLSPIDAAAVFESLCVRVRQEDATEAAEVLKRIADLIQERGDLFGQFLTFLGTLPDDQVPLATVPKIIALGVDTGQHALVRPLLDRWAESTTNTKLRSAARLQRDKRS